MPAPFRCHLWVSICFLTSPSRGEVVWWRRRGGCLTGKRAPWVVAPRAELARARWCWCLWLWVRHRHTETLVLVRTLEVQRQRSVLPVLPLLQEAFSTAGWELPEGQDCPFHVCDLLCIPHVLHVSLVKPRLIPAKSSSQPVGMSLWLYSPRPGLLP